MAFGDRKELRIERHGVEEAAAAHRRMAEATASDWRSACRTTRARRPYRTHAALHQATALDLLLAAEEVGEWRMSR